ncbi:MAG: hypothetical protein AAF529_18290 [Pseudomonadota bacterium]
MSPDLLGVLIGVVFIVPTIYLIKNKRWDSAAWPLFLVTLPVYYMLFGVLAMDASVVWKEFLYGLPYIATGLVVWRMRSARSLVVIGLAWLSHGLYDFYHDLFFVNPGVFSWYPAFCALVDIAVAGYLFLSYRRLVSADQSGVGV